MPLRSKFARCLRSRQAFALLASTKPTKLPPSGATGLIKCGPPPSLADLRRQSWRAGDRQAIGLSPELLGAKFIACVQWDDAAGAIEENTNQSLPASPVADRANGRCTGAASQARGDRA